ncbi:TetR/AcrR family transcriptional regulator [Nocardia sp. NPDC058658]|uniref:TetR/AcrR family transcriptional regulator n=1 Tax=Nocardia sp. NPDC058658 TaxID=3346580 RepID=UPI0036530865
MTGQRTRRTQVERREETRRILLDAAFDALVEFGFRGTTTSEVAHRAGVSLGALLHHFPTKAELLTADMRTRSPIPNSRSRFAASSVRRSRTAGSIGS